MWRYVIPFYWYYIPMMPSLANEKSQKVYYGCCSPSKRHINWRVLQVRHRGTNPMSNITWMFQIKELTLKGRPHVSLVQLHVKDTLIGSILSQFIHFLWILWILIIITWCSKKYFKLYIQLNISLFNCYISGPNRHQSDHRLCWASSQLDKNKNNSTLTQRQSFILRAATAQL